jgi:hypothetical protein
VAPKFTLIFRFFPLKIDFFYFEVSPLRATKTISYGKKTCKLIGHIFMIIPQEGFVFFTVLLTEQNEKSSRGKYLHQQKTAKWSSIHQPFRSLGNQRKRGWGP